VRIAIAAIVARVLLGLLLGWIVDTAARGAGLTVDYRSASLSLHRLAVHFHDVVAIDPDDEGVPPLFTAQQVDVDLSMARLLRGELVVVDAALAGARIHVERRADGALRLPTAWTTPATPAVTPATPTPTEEPPLRFDLPLRVASARLHDVRVVVEDLQRAAPTRFELTLDVDVRDLGDPARPGSIAVRAQSAPHFDRLWLDAETTTTEATLQVAFRGGVRGLPAPWLEGAPGVSVTMQGEIAAQRDDAAPTRAIVSGHAHADVSANDAALGAMDVKVAPTERDGDDVVIPFAITAAGERMLREFAITDATCRWSPARTSLAANVTARGVSLQRCAPVLEALGIALPADGVDALAALRVAIGTATGTPTVTASLEDVTIGHGDDRASLRRLAIHDLRHLDGRTSLARVEILGPDVDVSCTADGTTIAGLRFAPPPARPVPNDAPPSPRTAGFPAVSVDALDWRGLEVAFTDATLAQPATVRLLEGSVQGQDLALRDGVRPGRCEVTFMIEDAVGGLHARTELRTTADSLAANVTLDANDVTLRSFGPWLAGAGITPNLDGGSLRAMGSCTITPTAEATTLDVSLASVRLQDRGEALLTVRSVHGAGIRADANGLHLGKWTALDPFAVVRRAADGTMHAGGLAFTPREVPAAATAPPAPPRATTTTVTTTAPPAKPRRLGHGGIELRGGAVRWIDASATPARDLTASAAITIAADDGGGASVPFDAEVRVGRAIESCTAKGSYRLAPDAVAVDATIAGRGLRGDALSALLPAALPCTLADGTLGGHLVAKATLAPALGIDLRLDALRLADGDVEAMAIDSLVLDAPHVTSERIHVREFRIAGARALTASAPDGFHASGFRVQPGVEPPATTPNQIATPAASAAKPKTAALHLPALRIDAFDVSLDRLVWRDRRDDDGAPVVSTARLRLLEPWSTAADLADTPPAKFELTGAVTPLCREWRVTATIEPFELRPTIDLVVHAEGLDTTKIPAVMPRLAKDLQGLVTDGTLAANAHARIDLRRPSPDVLPLGQPLGAELSIENVRLVSGDGPPLASIGHAAVEVRSFDARTGALFVRSLEVDDPQIHAERSAAGIDCCGVRFLPQPPPPAMAEGTTTPPPAAAGPAGPAPEFALERLRVQGLTLDFTDTTTDPVTRLPLRDGDLSVQNVSTKPDAGARPIAFTFSATGGDVELERRVMRSSAIAGLLGSAVDVVAGKADQHTLEHRPLFDELRVDGQVSLHPAPKGRVRTTVRSLELPALRGLGKLGGVELADGVYDLDITADLREGAGLHLSSRSVFTWLSISEPPGGPISTYLRLPAPLDTVLFLLRNDDDEHVIPVNVELSPDRASGGELAGAAAEALGRIFADAIASASLRTAGALTGAVGLGASTAPLPTANLAFAPGDATPSVAGLEEVLAALADDDGLEVALVHELGSADLRRAATLANPPREIVAASLARLRAERDAALAARQPVATEVTALHATGRGQAARARHAALVELDARIGDLERTIDEAVRMLAGETAREQQRRTREAALAIAERRLDAVRGAVVARLGPAAEARVVSRRPRAVEAADAREGGRVVLTLRRRSAR